MHCCLMVALSFWAPEQNQGNEFRSNVKICAALRQTDRKIIFCNCRTFCLFCFVDLTFTLFQLPPFCMAGGKTVTWSRLQEYQVDSTDLQVGWSEVSSECLIERNELLYRCQILIFIPVRRREDVNYKFVSLDYCAVCVCMQVRVCVYIICIRISI
jgi:hypothetical protein